MRVVPALDRGLAILGLLSNGLIALGLQVFVLSSSAMRLRRLAYSTAAVAKSTRIPASYIRGATD